MLTLDHKTRARGNFACGIIAIVAAGLTLSATSAGETNQPESPRAVRAETKPPSRAELVRRARRLAKNPPPEGLSGSALNEWWAAALKARRVAFSLTHYQPAEELSSYADKELRITAAMFARARSGKPIPLIKGGREEAYFCPNDRSVQPFVRYLPESYDDDGKHPLLVYLHGYSPYLNIANWSTLRPELTAFAERTNACLVMPFGRGNTDFQGIGEQDVLRCVAEMADRFAIDRDRVFLIGFSMGGMGAYTIAGHHPHLFAGVIVVSGRGDYYFWHGIKPEKLPAHKRLMIDGEFGRSLLPNLRHLPILVLHGADDALIPVAEARHFVDLLKKNQAEVKYEEIPGGDHWITETVFANQKLADFVKKRKRSFPESFEHLVHHPSRGRSYWLQVTKLADASPPHRVEATVKEGHINIHADGVEEILVDRSLMPQLIRDFPLVSGEGLTIRQGEIDDRRIELKVDSDYRWGGMRDVHLNPFIIVAADKDADVPAARVREAAAGWRRYAQSEPRVELEKNLEIDDLKSNNLIFIGEPENSDLIKKALANDVVQVAADHFAVGERTFKRENRGLIRKRPSPWNPARSVVVQCGIPWGAHAAFNHRYDSIPGLIIYAPEREPMDPDGGNRVVFAGFPPPTANDRGAAAKTPSADEAKSAAEAEAAPKPEKR